MLEAHERILKESKEIWNNYKDKDITQINPFLKESLDNIEVKNESESR